jgi:hypothetical protein
MLAQVPARLSRRTSTLGIRIGIFPDRRSGKTSCKR